MADVTHALSRTEAGGGPFALAQTTIGVFLRDQPAHRIALGRDRAELRPLSRHEGWLLPAGADGLCLYDAPHEFLTLSLADRVLEEAGLTRARRPAPQVGALDPLLVQLALAMPGRVRGGALYAATLEQTLAQHLARLLAPPLPAVAALDDARLARVAARIADDPGADHRLAELAAEAGMSEAHFSRAFRAATGASPLQYVIAARIDRACGLLRATRLPVAEIAWRVGYGDVSRFGRHFKRRTGQTPAAWRAR